MSVNITLPDGAVRSFDHPVTVAEVAASIGPGLAKVALAGKVDGRVVDTSHRIEQDDIDELLAAGVRGRRLGLALALGLALRRIFLLGRFISGFISG